MTINEMDARLISQAEQITTLTDGALISVAEGEGQPQKNISFASLVNAINGKDSEIATANTVEYVRGFDANGNPIMINKSDLASIVAGLMGFENALTLNTQIATGDANNLGHGIYFYNQNIESLENRPGGNFGFIICIVNSTMKLQIGGWGGGSSALRCRNWYAGGGWSEWRDL